MMVVSAEACVVGKRESVCDGAAYSAERRGEGSPIELADCARSRRDLDDTVS